MTAKRIFRTLSSIEPQAIKWLWEPLIPYNKITILEGDPGLGKSYLCMHLAAIVTTGGRLPDGARVKQGRVLYITSEDDAADTVRPRMETMGADLSKVRVLVDYFDLSEEGHRTIRAEMEKFKPDLVVIDTLYSFLSDKVDLGKPTSIRAELHKLDRLFKEFGSAVILVRHWTKGGKGKAIYRGVGSIDVIGVVRTGLAVARHPEHENLRVLAQVKNNIGRRGQSLVYELVEQDVGLPLVEWRGTTHYTADDLEQQGGGDESEEERAIAFLKKALAEDPLPATELFAAAGRADLSRVTINRVKRKAGAESVKVGKGWIWRLRRPRS
jgi:DNA repair protein RadA/Sms